MKEFDLFLIKNGIPFTGSYTNKSKKITVFEGEKYFVSDKSFTNSELGLMSTIKRQARNFMERIAGKVQYGNAKYCHLTNEREGIYKDYVEIDINHAYIREAFLLGVIDEKTYKKAISEKISKPARLAALGSVATTKNEFIFNGTDFEVVSDVDRASTYPVFMLIAERVGMKINSVYEEINRMSSGGCLGWWVDAIFVKKEFADVAIKKFSEFEYGVKSKKLSSLIIREKQGLKYVYMNEISLPCVSFMSSGIKWKPFIIPDYRSEYYKDRKDEQVLKKLRVLG